MITEEEYLKSQFLLNKDAIRELAIAGFLQMYEPEVSLLIDSFDMIWVEEIVKSWRPAQWFRSDLLWYIEEQMLEYLEYLEYEDDWSAVLTGSHP